MRQVLVQEGDEREVTITSVGAKGDGIARIGGLVIIVPKAKKGAHVKIKIVKVTEKVAFAEVLEKLEKKPEPEYQPPPGPEYEDTEDFGSDLEDY